MQQPTFGARLRGHIATRTAHDVRADGQRRTVFLHARRVTIKRTVNGVKMRLSVPVENYAGVAVTFETRAEGSSYRVSLTHRDPELCVVLKESQDAAAIFCAWSDWAAFFALPALLHNADGLSESTTLVAKAPAKTPASSASTSRRAALLSKRGRRLRPRRGKRGLVRPPRVVRGERGSIRTE
jgi:Family of unknown function (DUF6101)